MAVIEDQYGRRFRTLRVSLVSHCNLGCVYCVAGDDGKSADVVHAGGAGAVLGWRDLLTTIGRLHGQLGLKTVRLTGGEPLLYKDILLLVEGIRALGIGDIRLTTNGFLLERMAEGLAQAGVKGMNVSLDAIDEEVFFRMSRRRSAGRVCAGIDAALRAGMEVKINSVIMKGINESEILPLMDHAFSRGLRIRFLELMAMGHLQHGAAAFLCRQEEMLGIIATRWHFSRMERVQAATASYWRTEEGHCFGIIANESEPFCGDCDRLRLDSHGNIYGCLSSNTPIGLDLEAGDGRWAEQLGAALGQKQALRFVGSGLSMLEIGG